MMYAIPKKLDKMNRIKPACNQQVSLNASYPLANTLATHQPTQYLNYVYTSHCSTSKQFTIGTLYSKVCLLSFTFSEKPFLNHEKSHPIHQKLIKIMLSFLQLARKKWDEYLKATQIRLHYAQGLLLNDAFKFDTKFWTSCWFSHDLLVYGKLMVLRSCTTDLVNCETSQPRLTAKHESTCLILFQQCCTSRVHTFLIQKQFVSLQYFEHFSA